MVNSTFHFNLNETFSPLPQLEPRLLDQLEGMKVVTNEVRPQRGHGLGDRARAEALGKGFGPVRYLSLDGSDHEAVLRTH